MKKIFFYAALAMLVVSCKDKDLYEGGNVTTTEEEKDYNEFNFATVQSVKLSVDYSSFKTKRPIYFSVYSENPFEGEEESRTLKSDIKPLLEAYTNANGIFNEDITLPAYAKHLYVVTGDFQVAQTLTDGEVNKGEVNVTVSNNEVQQASARVMRRSSVDEDTNSLEYLYQLMYEVDVKTGDKTDKQIYKDWYTPLGTWNAGSGRPNYLLDPATANPELLFNEEEMNGLYETISNALTANKTCSEQYRIPADLQLQKASEVSVSFLGSMTCWNNTLGYYYYDDKNMPTSLEDLNIIMLYPNTQDGKWWRDWMKNPKFYDNIALNRGDCVQLVYYPNIANGDLSNATTIFPEHTRIGFILKSNGWGMQKTREGKKFFNSYNGLDRNHEAALSRQYNVWMSSTDGFSYCNTTGLAASDCKIQNPEGMSRTAKFNYQAESGENYVVVGFEDACNDLDYDDVVLALRPADAFNKQPQVEDRKTSTTGVYAFEDKWPLQGDYDINDVMVEATHEKVFSKKSRDNDYKIYQETFSLTTDQNFVVLKTGLAATLNTKVTPASIVMKKVNNKTNDTTLVNYVVDGNTYLFTEDITKELRSTYIIELYYSTGISKLSDAAELKPFIYRNEVNNKRWEVHLPFEAPTDKMNYSYFGTMDDKSVPAEGKYYIRKSNYPFAFYLEGVTMDNFKNTLLKRENESTKISDLYPYFLPWVESKGNNYADWYLNPKTK